MESKYRRRGSETLTARHRDPAERLAVYTLAVSFGAAPTRTTRYQIRRLLKAEDHFRKLRASGALASLPRPFGPVALAVAASSPSIEVRDLLWDGALFPNAFFEWAADSLVPELRRQAARHPECPDAIVARLRLDPDPYVATAAAQALGFDAESEQCLDPSGAEDDEDDRSPW